MTSVIAIAFVLWGFLGPASLNTASTGALDWVMTNTGWAFVLLASFFVVFVLWLAASRYGNIPLGTDDEKPEFKTVSWVAMMFSAGMGIGLMFYGVAEPLFHYASPPPGTVQGADAAGRCRPRWPPRCSTGRCTRGRSTPSSASRSPTAPSARAARS